MSSKVQHSEKSTPVRRILQNTGWLLGGKGFGAICSIIYLAILTRSLGLKDFGHFSLIFATAQAMISIAGIPTWQAVVRFGSVHVHAKDWKKFGQLGLVCGLIDAAGAIMGSALAALVIFGFAPVLDLNPNYIDIAFWFCAASLWALVSAPTGIIRALNRFDVAVYVEAVVPSGRLIAGIAIWLIGPSVERFLLAWALIDIIEAALYWIMARRICPEAVRWANFGQLRNVMAENMGIGRFFLVTYAASTVDAGIRNGPLLAVGSWAGTSAAGLYRLAAQLSQALSKLSSLLARSVYAEITRMKVADNAMEFRKLALQTSLIAGLAGLVVVTATLLIGKQLLMVIGGADFGQGGTILIALVMAASIDMARVPFEPVLHSTGRAHHELFARVLGLIGLGVGLWLLIDTGPSGAAWAVASASFLTYLAMAAAAFHAVQRPTQDV